MFEMSAETPEVFSVKVERPSCRFSRGHLATHELRNCFESHRCRVDSQRENILIATVNATKRKGPGRENMSGSCKGPSLPVKPRQEPVVLSPVTVGAGKRFVYCHF